LRQGQFAGEARAWQKVFRDRGVNYVVLQQQDTAPLMELVGNWFRFDPANWVMLYADGRTFIYGWRADGRDRFRDQSVAFDAQAFGKAASSWPVPADSVADVPEGGPGPLAFWWLGLPTESLAQAEAEFALHQGDTALVKWAEFLKNAGLQGPWMLSSSIGPLGVAGGGTGSVAALASISNYWLKHAELDVRAQLQLNPLPTRDAGLPAFPLLAVRA